VDPRGGDSPRGHGVRPDPAGPEVDRDGAREGEDGALAGDVGSAVAHCGQGCGGGDVDDNPAVVLEHVWDHGPAEQEGCSHVDGKGLVPLLRGRGDEVADEAEPGVVDQYVEPLPAGDSLAQDAFDVVLVGEVTDDGLHLAHEPAELLQPLAVAVDGQDVRTFGGQELGCRTTDSRGGAGEENGLAGEP